MTNRCPTRKLQVSLVAVPFSDDLGTFCWQNHPIMSQMAWSATGIKRHALNNTSLRYKLNFLATNNILCCLYLQQSVEKQISQRCSLWNAMMMRQASQFENLPKHILTGYQGNQSLRAPVFQRPMRPSLSPRQVHYLSLERQWIRAVCPQISTCLFAVAQTNLSTTKMNPATLNLSTSLG